MPERSDGPYLEAGCSEIHQANTFERHYFLIRVFVIFGFFKYLVLVVISSFVVLRVLRCETPTDRTMGR
jgi:hypothetical protein